MFCLSKFTFPPLAIARKFFGQGKKRKGKIILGEVAYHSLSDAIMSSG
jgi:hypothetical protein